MMKWQHVGPAVQLHGRDGLRTVIAQLQGFQAAAGAWEREILPARLGKYGAQECDLLIFPMAALATGRN